MSSSDVMDSIREMLAAAEAALQHERDPQAFAKRLVSLISGLEQKTTALLGQDQDRALTPEEQLYYRAVKDHQAMQEQLSLVRAVLGDRDLAVRILQRKGHELDSTQQHLALVGAMDQALQHLIHLMQYDTLDRHEVDIRQGFQLTSGSTNYGRFYFAPPKPNSGN